MYLQHGVKLNQTLRNIVNGNMLSQLKRTPTMGENMLDLIFITIPDQITITDTVSGMSDNEAMMVEIGVYITLFT